MSQNYVLKKGLNIPVAGEAELRVSKTVAPGIVAVQPTDFKGFLPRLLVKEGDRVLCGSPVMADKKNADILLTSPVSGTVREIVRGEKRKLLAVLVEADVQQQCVDFGVKDVTKLDGKQVREALLASGLWPWLVQRPYGILADPAAQPRDIFVSTFSTAPLAPDAAFCFGSELKAAQAGVCALTKLTSGKVHVSLDGNAGNSPFAALQHCELHTFQGPHPAGNVGVQISHIAPIRKEDIVWTVSLAGLVAIGKIFNSDFGMFYQVPLGQGLLIKTTQTIDTYVYRALLEMNNVGMSSAASVFQAIIGFLLVIISNAIVRKVDSENALF